MLFTQLIEIVCHCHGLSPGHSVQAAFLEDPHAANCPAAVLERELNTYWSHSPEQLSGKLALCRKMMDGVRRRWAAWWWISGIAVGCDVGME